LGTYESALHPVINEMIAAAPKRVVDVGAAEGYYAVGFARRLPASQIVASDTDPQARQLCQKLAAMNGVAERMTIVGGLTPQELDAYLGEGVLLLVDAEGAERELLKPRLMPNLASTVVVVEIHDFIDRGISNLMQQRFRATHHCDVFDENAPDLSTLTPRLDRLSPIYRSHAVSEYRPEPMQWAVMRPRR
jgi:predicted O-methyltransferase YrrM